MNNNFFINWGKYYVERSFNKYGYGKFPYKQMTDEEIIKFPIHNFADDNCDLFIWVTHSKLPIGLKILNEWGFKYHCLLTWIKNDGICISGFHRKTEYIIYGYKGKMGIDVKEGYYIPTSFKGKIKKHSTKPDLFYDLIGKRTKEPRIDIFSRRNIYGFDSWGDELPKLKQTFIES